MASLEELSEELTIQQVMLNSMEGQNFEGVDEERAERRGEIVRLKGLIDDIKAGRTAGGDDSRGSSSGVGGVESSGRHDGSRSPAARRVLETRPTPSGARRFGDSPAGPSRQNYIKTESPLNRKRDFGSTSFDTRDGSSKSRRTDTYDPFGALEYRPKKNLFDDVDFIDLTGDDEITAGFVAEQVKAENRFDREKRDREMAIRLSQETPSSSSNHVAHTGDAFGRIMATQERNSARGPVIQLDDSDMESLHNPDSDLDPAQEIGSNLAMTPDRSALAAWHSGRGADTSRFEIGPPPSYLRDFMGRGAPATSSLPSSGPMYPSHLPPGILPPGYLPSGQPHPGIRTLSGIVDRVNHFDFANGVDGNGAPLPERVTNYFNDAMHDSRVSTKELEELLQNISPDMELPERDAKGKVDGLKPTLYLHQQIALNWMQKMEDGSNKGGILADDMGLGKTVSTLSLMLTRPAKSRPKTNLIVGPVALIRQWEEEIKSKVATSHKLSILVFHGKKGKATTEEFLTYDVVLTTYGTLAHEYKSLEKLELQLAERDRSKPDFNDRSVASRFPLLNPKAKFLRIILDEAQCIKNKNTQAAKACSRLTAKFRWCLSGTPMMNSVEELYSLLKFLKIKPYSSWEKFLFAFGVLFNKGGRDRDHNQDHAMGRLRAILSAVMLRRKKNSMLNGQPILRLPEKTEEVTYGELGTDERDFYKQLEHSSQVLFNKYLREGSVGKNYSQVLVLLLRLRQACCHPHLNLDVDDVVSPGSNPQMEVSIKNLDPTIVNRIKGSAPPFECPICYDATQSPCFFVPCGHDSCSQCLARLVDSTAANAIREGQDPARGTNARCPVCREWFDSHKCFTYSAFQEVHMPKAIAEGEEDDGSETESGSDDDGDDDSTASEDEDDEADDVDEEGNLKDFIVDDFADTESEGDEVDNIKQKLAQSSTAASKKVRKSKKRRAKKLDKGKGKDDEQEKAADVKPSMLKALRQDANKNRRSYEKYMAYLRKTWLTSAKVTECMRLLKEIEPTGEKTIIFSQWTLLLDLIEVAMEHEDFFKKPVRYDGSLSANERNEAAHKFRNNNNVSVILVSLKAGNAGLNLAIASRVIILDPFWNPYTEMQAIDRAYRIGQTRSVKVYRILTKETVEDRIVELQNKKKEMIESAMDESEGRKISRLSTRELRFLFDGTR